MANNLPEKALEVLDLVESELWRTYENMGDEAKTKDYAEDVIAHLSHNYRGSGV